MKFCSSGSRLTSKAFTPGDEKSEWPQNPSTQVTFPFPAIMQSNEPAGDWHDFMQGGVECDYWVSGEE